MRDIDNGAVVLPEFQRDFVWEIEKTIDLFDLFVRDIFVGALIYGLPSFEITVRELDTRPRSGRGSRRKLALTSYTRPEIEKRVKTHGFRLLLDGQQRATSIYRALKGTDEIYFVISDEADLPQHIQLLPYPKRTLENVLSEFRAQPIPAKINVKMSDVYRVCNLENGNPVTSSSSLEDHHIFPKDYLRKNSALIESSLDGQVLIDCVANRTLIPRLTNIKVSNKSPSMYSNGLMAKNPDITAAFKIPLDFTRSGYRSL